MRPATRLPTAELVRSLPLFHPLDAEPLNRIADAARSLVLARGTTVIDRGAQLDGFYAVLEGTLKIFLLSCNGTERVIRLLTPGDSFGEAIMFNNLPSPVYVQALSDVELCYFPKEHVYDALANQPRFTQCMLKSLSQMLHQLIGDLEACCMQNARQRIAHYLLCQARQGPDHCLAVQLPASKAVVASTLNLSAETFSRELHQLAREDLIAIRHRTILLTDSGALTMLAEQGRTPASDH